MDLTILADSTTELCECQPLSILKRGQERQASEDYLPMTPVTPELGAYLREALARYFPRSSPVSVLLLHITQLEHVHISPKSTILHRRHRFHAPASFMEQVLTNVGRTIRSSDPMIVHGGAGAAIIFPDVDQEGAFSIVERAFHSINLLQPETVIPPLARETDIFLGMGSYPKPANSFDELLHHTSCVAHRLTLRPAVSARIQRLMPSGNMAVPQGLVPTGNEAAPLRFASAGQSGRGLVPTGNEAAPLRFASAGQSGRGLVPSGNEAAPLHITSVDQGGSLLTTNEGDEISVIDEIDETKLASEIEQAHILSNIATNGSIPPPANSGIPFMQLPTKLPARLKHLIPYHLARELRCVPVGRDHNRLTVAMAQVVDVSALDLLKETTGMAIYPVACEIDALDALLANEW